MRFFRRGSKTPEPDELTLHLKYETTPENASRFAADIVTSAREISEVALDYSPDSLATIDEIIESFRAEGLTARQIGETLFGFGCYVGEVFVRNASGKWRATEGTPMQGSAGGPFVIELRVGSDVSFVNPLDKVFKRLQNGPEDDLPYFYRVFTTPSAEPPGVRTDQ